MELKRLTEDSELSAFDCGDDDLNEFLLKDAKGFLEKRIANSYLLMDGDRIVAYFCLLNDKISKQEVTNSQWRKIKDRFPEGKKFSSYPAIKIGRFAVSAEYRGQQIGTKLMNMIKSLLDSDRNYSAFRFLTVDAYISATSFYTQNGFVKLTRKEENPHTDLMFFDMREIV